MFNTQEYQYTKDLVYTMKLQDYEYYFCTTITNTGDNRIIECLFSKNELVLNSNTVVGTDTKFYTISSQNYQTTNDVYVLSGKTSLNLSEHEYFYTNISGDYPNLLAQEIYQENYNKENSISYNLHLNDIYIIILLLSIIISFLFVKPFFRLK